MFGQEQESEEVAIPTDITDYIEKIDQDEDEEEVCRLCLGVDAAICVSPLFLSNPSYFSFITLFTVLPL